MKFNIDHISLGEQIKRLAANPQCNLTANQIRVVVAIERVVARLETEAQLRNHLIFKGGFVLLKTIQNARFTRDLDALAFDIDQDKIVSLAKKALGSDLNDGMWFVDIHVETVPDQGEYGGLRLNCAFQIGETPPEPAKIKKLSRLHVDIGFGDKVPDRAKGQIVEMPTALGSAPVSWRIYPLEFIFAEKLQTLLERGSTNSRAKDVYDLVKIFPKCKDTTELVRAIRSVFQNRKTELPNNLAEVVGEFDPGVLKAAWGSVNVAGKIPEFEECWNSLIDLLNKLTKAMVK